jgi:hypothetical protein
LGKTSTLSHKIAEFNSILALVVELKQASVFPLLFGFYLVLNVKITPRESIFGPVGLW